MRYNMQSKHYAICISIFFLSLSLTACDKMVEKTTEAAIEKAIEGETGGKVDIDTSGDGEVTITTEDTSITATDGGDTVAITSNEGDVSILGGDNVKIPDDFPKDIPLPQGLKPMSVMKGDGGFFLLHGEVKGSAKSVENQIKVDLEKGGWKKVMTFSESGTTGLIMDKGKRQLNYSIVEQDDKTTEISINVMSES